MADTKVSGLTALAGADVDPATDVLPIVDTSVTTTKKIAVSELQIAMESNSSRTHAIGMYNGTIVASRSGNAETFTIKTKAGADPSTTDPVSFVFRNATAATGDYAIVNATTALSITAPSTATLGASNGVAFNVWLVVFNDGGTLRLGVVNPAVRTAGASSIMALPDNGIASSTLTPANSAKVIYTTGAAVTSKAYRVLGRIEYSLATAGTWNTAPTVVAPYAIGVPLPGNTVQVSADFATTGSSTSSGSNTDVTNGSLTITPVSAANAVKVDFSWAYVANTGVLGANYQGGCRVVRGATQLGASMVIGSSTGAAGCVTYSNPGFTYLDFPNSSASQTYKLQQNGDGLTTVQTSSSHKVLTEIQA